MGELTGWLDRTLFAMDKHIDLEYKDSTDQDSANCFQFYKKKENATMKVYKGNRLYCKS